MPWYDCYKDPFFQEWVFYPLGTNAQFWLDLLTNRSHISMQLQIAQCRLLQYSGDCPLIARAIEQYMIMKTALHKATETEDCFSITMEHWNCIRGELITYEFACRQHEIQFFKVIKPLFGGEKEYFFLRHHADLFGGADSRFWERQCPRMGKFVTDNPVFALAYTTGNTRHDEWWYCRAEDRDETSHVWLVAAYLGMVRYMQITFMSSFKITRRKIRNYYQLVYSRSWRRVTNYI